jgi:hypothetical protein
MESTVYDKWCRVQESNQLRAAEHHACPAKFGTPKLFANDHVQTPASLQPFAPCQIFEITDDCLGVPH